MAGLPSGTGFTPARLRDLARPHWKPGTILSEGVRPFPVGNPAEVADGMAALIVGKEDIAPCAAIALTYRQIRHRRKLQKSQLQNSDNTLQQAQGEFAVQERNIFIRMQFFKLDNVADFLVLPIYLLS